MRKRKPQMADTERWVGAALAAGRLAIGAGIWVAPTLTAKALGMKRWDGEALTVARLAATRDLILGVWLAGELRDGGRPLAPTTALVACDAGDALAFGLLAANGGDSVGAGLRGLAAAGPATAVGVWLANRLRT